MESISEQRHPLAPPQLQMCSREAEVSRFTWDPSNHIPLLPGSDENKLALYSLIPFSVLTKTLNPRAEPSDLSPVFLSPCLPPLLLFLLKPSTVPARHLTETLGHLHCLITLLSWESWEIHHLPVSPSVPFRMWSMLTTFPEFQRPGFQGIPQLPAF